MSFTQTPNLHLYKPTINSDNDQWGTHLNSNADTLDAAVPAPSGTTPNMDGAAGPGSATAYARGDHTHPTDSTRAPTASPTFTGTVTIPAGATIIGYAPLASPVFTGTPNLPTGTVAVTQTAGNSTTAPATTAFVQTAVAPALNNIGRNLLDNAALNTVQRGLGPFTAPWSYTADRWWHSGNTTSPVTSMSTSLITTPAADLAIIGNEMVWDEVQCVFTGTATAGSTCQFAQGIEDPARISNKTVIVSLYARCATGTLRLGVNFQQFFGSGGATAVNINGQSVTITTTLARYSFVFTLPSVLGKTFGAGACTYLQFWLSADATQNTNSGSVGVQSGTVFMTGFQCEFAQPGQTQPTPLEVLCYADDLARCQRYYQTTTAQLNGYGVPPSGMGYTTPLTVEMRTTPTVTLLSTGSISNTTNPPVAGSNFGGSNPGAVWSFASILATGGGNYSYTLACSADL